MKTGLTILIVCLTVSVAYSQNDFGSIDSIVHFEAIPTDPVFDLLGLSGSQIEQPGTVSKFFGSILNASDVRGNLVTGFAMSIAPYQLFRGSRLKLRDYIENWGTRFASNIQLSVGTSPTKNADSSLNLGIGLRFVFWNSGDRRLDNKEIQKTIDQKKKILNDLSIKLMSAANEEEEAKLLDEFEKGKSDLKRTEEEGKVLKEEQKSINSPRWNTKSLDLNIGVLYRASDSKLTESKLSKVRAWLNGGIGTSSVQLLAQLGVLYQLKEADSLKDSLFTTVSAMMRVGTPSFRFGLGVYTVKFQRGVVSFASEIRLSSIGWLTFSLDRNVEEHKQPYWTQSMGIKTTLGNINF